MAITDKEEGVWGLEEVYNKINQGGIWDYSQPMEMWGWGANPNGSLGLNNVTEYSSPVQIGSDTTWTSPRGGDMNAGDGQFQAVKTDGTLWRAGWNYLGALGQGDSTSHSSPIQIGTDTDWLYCSGRLTAGAVKTDGTLWTWGRNDYGQLGQNNQTPYYSPKQVGSQSTWKNLCMEGLCNFGTKTDGTLWAWGVGEHGSLGLNGAGPGHKYSSPKQVGTDTTWRYVHTDESTNSTGIKTDGTLCVWGLNSEGGLGLNDQTSRSSPTQIPGTDWVYGLQNQASGIYLKTDGTLWTCGGNSQGQLGHNNETNYSSPRQIPGTDWTAIGQGGNSAFCAIKGGGLYTWGYNASGQLGQDNRTEYSSPTQVGTSTKWYTASQSYGNSIIGVKGPE